MLRLPACLCSASVTTIKWLRIERISSWIWLRSASSCLMSACTPLPLAALLPLPLCPPPFFLASSFSLFLSSWILSAIDAAQWSPEKTGMSEADSMSLYASSMS